MKVLTKARLYAALGMLVFVPLTFSAVAVDKPAKSVFDKPGPEHVADLLEIEKTVREIAKKAIDCTVALQVGRAYGSGVIVSQDGYVLTAAHVVGGPGREVRVQLSDETVLQAETLGLHAHADIGLVKITDKGNWSYAPMVPHGQGPMVGDWCLAAGHTDGFHSQRTAPLRLGRVIDVQENVVRTDCPLNSGDSGGPLFDMKGHVIAIHSRITADVTQNLHGPTLAAAQAWEELVAGKIYPARPPSRFLDRLDSNHDGLISRSELPSPFHRRVLERLAEQFDFDPNEPISIKELIGDLGWRESGSPFLGPIESGEEQIGQSLFRRLFVRGRDVREPFRRSLAKIPNSTVRVECDGTWKAWGTIVDENGWIVTKASELGGDVSCVLADGKRVAGRIAGIDKEYDLALLSTNGKEMNGVNWSSLAEPSPGSWLITPGVDGQAASVGVVSVKAREIIAIPAVLGVEVETGEDEARIARVFPNSGAAEAGMEDGDVITHILDRAVRNIGELRDALKAYRAGDVVTATITRQDKNLKVDVTLGSSEDVFFFRFGRRQLSGALSRRRDGFPAAVQHDSVLRPSMCGGPVFDISGQFVGVNIARADRTSSYLVPAAAVQGFVERMISEESN